jgi:hypothetical protein
VPWITPDSENSPSVPSKLCSEVKAPLGVIPNAAPKPTGAKAKHSEASVTSRASLQCIGHPRLERGERAGVRSQLMRPVVARLSVDDMVSIAAYTASLNP